MNERWYTSGELALASVLGCAIMAAGFAASMAAIVAIVRWLM